jgi:hypothetical protein
MNSVPPPFSLTHLRRWYRLVRIAHHSKANRPTAEPKRLGTCGVIREGEVDRDIEPAPDGFRQQHPHRLSRRLQCHSAELRQRLSRGVQQVDLGHRVEEEDVVRCVVAKKTSAFWSVPYVSPACLGKTIILKLIKWRKRRFLPSMHRNAQLEAMARPHQLPLRAFVVERLWNARNPDALRHWINRDKVLALGRSVGSREIATHPVRVADSACVRRVWIDCWIFLWALRANRRSEHPEVIQRILCHVQSPKVRAAHSPVQAHSSDWVVALVRTKLP